MHFFPIFIYFSVNVKNTRFIISNLVASLIVSNGQHTLDNKIVLEASFPAANEEPMETGSAEDTSANGRLRLLQVFVLPITLFII